jgi:hypothetical protein
MSILLSQKDFGRDATPVGANGELYGVVEGRGI